MLRKMLFALCLLAPAASQAAAMTEAEITAALNNKIRMVRHMALNPLLVKAVRKQNAEGLDSATIERRDRRWAQADSDDPLKAATQEGQHSVVIRRFVDMNSEFSDVVLTDDQGAAVAGYPLAGGYWQGDRPEWQQAFNEGEGRVYLSPLRQESASNVITTAIAAPVLNRSETIGVLLVGVRLGGR